MRKFSDRHIGISSTDEKAMLDFLGLKSLNHLIEQTIPKEIINNAELKLDKAISEAQYSSHIYELSQKNKYFKNYIGLGYNESILPPVIQRNILENPWLVYCLHSLSSRSCTRKTGSLIKLSNCNL